MASQLTSAGKAIDVFFDLNYSAGLILCAAFVIGYCIFGGYRSVIMTDFVQGLLMASVLIILPIYFIFFELGGWSAFWQQAKELDPILLNPTGGAVGSAAIGLVLGYLLSSIKKSRMRLPRRSILKRWSPFNTSFISPL